MDKIHQQQDEAIQKRAGKNGDSPGPSDVDAPPDVSHVSPGPIEPPSPEDNYIVRKETVPGLGRGMSQRQLEEEVAEKDQIIEDLRRDLRIATQHLEDYKKDDTDHKANAELASGQVDGMGKEIEKYQQALGQMAERARVAESHELEQRRRVDILIKQVQQIQSQQHTH